MRVQTYDLQNMNTVSSPGRKFGSRTINTASNLPGRKFGSLTVLQLIEGNRKKCLCRCDCGVVKELFINNLTRLTDRTRSCGSPACRPPRSDYKNLAGQKFGHLLVVSYAGNKRWNCQCECGNQPLVATKRLNEGRKRNREMSCGCMHGYKNPARRHRRLVSNDEAAIQYLWKHQQRQVRKINGADPWDISKEEFERLIFSPCHYCGAIGSNRIIVTYRQIGSIGELRYNGLDRVDAAQGYVASNIVPCCWQCNKTKGNLPFEEFVAYLLRVTQHLGIR